MTIKELQARQQDAKLRGQAILTRSKKEGRELTDDEESTLDEIKKELDSYKKKLDYLEAFVKDEPAPEKKSKRADDDEDKEDEEEEKAPKGDPDKDERSKSFRSLGDQMMAVYRASQPGAKFDTRLSTRAASGLNATNPSDGGFLVQTDFVKDLLKRTYETGILASKCKRIPLTTNANSIKINAVDEVSRKNGSRWGGLQTYWENEADQFTASRPKFRQMELSLKKLTGLCYVTDELLQDASALEKVIKEGFAEEFGFKMDDVILRGKGAGQPLGILKSDALVKVEKEKGQTEKITVENLVKMWSRMWSRSRTNSVWFINPEIEPLLYTLTVGDKPVYIPAGFFRKRPPLLNRADIFPAAL